MINKLQHDITGIILAGGKSRRMGRDKGLLPYHGKPMVQYSIDLLSVFCSRIIISTSNSEYTNFGLETIPDITPESGPMGGLYTCLKASRTLLNVCIPCDIPLMNQSVIDHLILNADGNACVVPCTPFPEPLVSIYPLTVIPVMEQLMNEGKYKMADIYNRFPVKYLTLDEFQDKNTLMYFRNVNSPADLED